MASSFAFPRTCQWIVVGENNKLVAVEVIVELLRHSPLQRKKLQLVRWVPAFRIV